MKGQKTYEAALLKLNEYISARNMRKSRVREMVLEQACMLPPLFTAEQLAKAAQILHAIDRQRGKSATQYEVIPGKQTYMQIQCSKCGRVSEIKDKAIDHLIRVRKYINFDMQCYTLLIYGECKHCRKPKIQTEK